MTKPSEEKKTDVLGSDTNEFAGGIESLHPSEDEVPYVNQTTQWQDAFPGTVPATITDEVDGLPRPDDGQMAPTFQALSYEDFVCMEDDRTFVESFARWNDDGSEIKRRTFAPGDVTRRFGETVAMVDGNWVSVVPVRQRCKHYMQMIRVADDIVDGDGKRVEPIDRMCGAMRTIGGAFWSMENAAIVACSMREPQDLVSADRLRQRDLKKIKEGEERSFRSIIGGPVPGTQTDWDKAAEPEYGKLRVWTCNGVAGVPVGSGPRVYMMSPGSFVVERDVGSVTPKYIILPDEDWQPPNEYFKGKMIGPEAWGRPGDAIIRMAALDEPPYTSDSDADTWPAFKSRMLAMQINNNPQACAREMKAGAHVMIITRSMDEKAIFLLVTILKSLYGGSKSALDHLQEVEAWADKELCTNYTYRSYLRRMISR